MVDVFNAVVKPYEPAIDLFGHGPVVLTVCILVELVGVPKPSGSECCILGRGHQFWLHDQVHAKRFACMVIVGRPSQLNAATASETIAIPTGLIPVTHSVAVDSVCNELGVSVAGLGLGSVKALGPELLQGFGPVVQVLFQDSEVSTLMAALADKGSLA